MVLLTITPEIMRALSGAREIAPKEFATLQSLSEPSLTDAKAGDPISHRQLIDLSKLLKKDTTEIASREDADGKLPREQAEGPVVATLNSLLHGSTVYIPPPPPKKKPTPEYVALMARLRAEEEARAYDRMVNPNPLSRPEAFSQRFPNTTFTLGVDNSTEEDELSYEEVHRQIILIINVLISIVACSIFIWVAARHWSVPKRLGLSMSGSGAVAIAEVVVYSGYVRKVAEAKRKEKKKPEVKQLVQSWIIDSSKKETSVSSVAKEKADDGIRYRKGKHR